MAKSRTYPEHIRDELNWRLNDGDEGKELVAWLNAKPEVIDVVTRLFDGKPISEQNLSLWRTHGYLRWHAYHVVMRETCELAQNSGVVKATGIDCEKMLGALKANYASMIQSWMVTPTGQMTYRMEVIKNLTGGVLAISRDEIQRERLELLRQKQADKSESSGLIPNGPLARPWFFQIDPVFRAGTVSGRSKCGRVSRDRNGCWRSRKKGACVSPTAAPCSASARSLKTSPRAPTPTRGPYRSDGAKNST